MQAVNSYKLTNPIEHFFSDSMSPWLFPKIYDKYGQKVFQCNGSLKWNTLQYEAIELLTSSHITMHSIKANARTGNQLHDIKAIHFRLLRIIPPKISECKRK